METAILSFPWATSEAPRRRRSAADGSVLAVALVLALVGLVMVFSASAVVAGSRFHDSIYFLKRQLAWLGFGVMLLYAVSRLDYAVWRKLALPLLGLTALLLVIVLV